MSTVRLALAQINTTVGDITGNADKMLGWIAKARSLDVDIIAFPELATIGYPPEDLLFRDELIRANLAARDRIVAASEGIVVVFGFIDSEDDIYNAAAIACDGTLAGVYRKHLLPNYGVFDEDRYFQSGSGNSTYSLDDLTFGVTICEDIWYPGGPADEQALNGDAYLLLNLSASPYHAGKIEMRDRMVSVRASDNDSIVALANLVGGQDELVFDGGSLICDESGSIVARGKQFDEDFLTVDLRVDPIFRHRLRDPRRRKEKHAAGANAVSMPRTTLRLPKADGEKRDIVPRMIPRMDRLEEIYHALTHGVRDYIDKNGFKKAVVALSGGIDSALTAAVAVDALGPDRVVGVTMPSRFSSNETRSDAGILAENLGIRFLTLPIEDTFTSFVDTLAEVFEGVEEDLTEENLQARTRGTLVMALSNKFGWMVLTTGNKSEMSVGYATLYGDMAGGFAVLKDVYKTTVYELSDWRNAQGPRIVIPETTITRAPSAELRDNQTDQDSLPPYDILDQILESYVERDESVAEITSLGFDEETVRSVIRLVDRSEYKRRQAPPGIKITPRAFGKDRRLPITLHLRYRQGSS
jgi:NAD+ synthase (glutamine-hydrolysing)